LTRGRIIGAIVALVILVAIVGGFYLRAKGSVPQVTVVTAERATLGVTVSASGDVEADHQADVFPPTTATIDELKVHDGQTVKAGQVLAILDKQPLEQQVEQSHAALVQAQSQTEQIQNQAPSSQDRAASSANVTAAAKAYNNALAAFRDAQQSLEEATSTVVRSAARQAVRQADQARQQALAGLLSARANSAKLSSSSTAASLQAANANEEAASSSLQIAQENLEKAEMKAPMDGVVIFNVIGTPSPSGQGPTASEGAAVTPAVAPFTIVELSTLRFNADVDEVDVPKLKVGMKAFVTLDAFPGERFATKVSRIQVRATQTATGGTVFPVYLPLVDIQKPILIGMKGDSSIETSALKGALTVPIEAVLEDGSQSYVFVLEGDKAQRRNVRVGTLTDTQAQILSGLSEGEKVIEPGSANLTDGMTVRVK